MPYDPTNNPYIPGDPYSYDLKWMVDKMQQWTDPLDSADRAKASEEAAKVSEQQSEAWAVGTIDGDPVPADAPQHDNNSKHWSDEAADSAADAAASEAAAKNYADHIADPVSGLVTDWLADHITQPTTPAIDTSLTIAGAAADAKATGDRIGILDSHFVNKIIHVSPGENWSGFENIGGFYVEAPDSTHLYLRNNAGYRVFYLATKEETEIYIDSPSLGFLDVAVMTDLDDTEWEATGSDYVLRGSSAIRYRLSDGNLPDSGSPLILPANSAICIGTTIAVTTGSGAGVYMTMPYADNILFNDLAQTTGTNTDLPMSQKAVTDALQTINPISVSILSSSSKRITFGEYQMDFNYYDNAGSRQHAWNFATGITKSGNTIIPTGTDIIGPIKEIGESDFMGGVHGDETNVYTKMYMDGAEVTSNVTGKELDIFMYSHLTRVSDGTNVIDRIVHINIVNNKMTIENTFKCLVSNFHLELAYNGGLAAWYQNDCDFMQLNDRDYDISSPSSISLTPDIISYGAHINGGILTLENLIGHDESTYKAGLTYFSNETPKRLKAYIATDAGSTWNVGHICNGKFSISFK